MTFVKRPLSSITDEEAKEAYQIAFGKAESEYAFQGISGDEDKLELYGYSLKQYRTDISIWSDGSMAATGYDYNGYIYSPIYFAVKLVDYLRSIGIMFEENDDNQTISPKVVSEEQTTKPPSIAGIKEV